MSLLSCLPRASFVAFEVRKIKEPLILWRNAALPLDQPLENYAYFRPLYQSDWDVTTAETVAAYGERYGGKGLGRNGGGVRCGLIGEVQIKGIGANQLAGFEADDYFHTYGGAALSEGIREALWGEVCNIALPYGAVRVHGLIGTRTEVPVKYPVADGPTMASRALIVREAALRPAHFMRAVYHRPMPEMAHQPSDVARTKIAVSNVIHALRGVFQFSDMKSDADFLNAALHEIFSRQAHQMAAARAKKIAHGALTESNICVDGRWIDFGRISSLSDYGPIIIGKKMPNFLKEASSIKSIIGEFLFYLKKYLPKDLNRSLISPRKLSVFYDQVLEKRLKIEFLLLTGIPEADLINIPTWALSELHECFVILMKEGNGSPFKIVPAEKEKYELIMPDKTGEFHLNSILRCAGFCVNEETMSDALKPALANDGLRLKLVRALCTVRAIYLSGLSPLKRGAAFAMMAINSARLNTNFTELYHMVLNPNINKISTSDASLSDTIDVAISKAKVFFGKSDPNQMHLSVFFGASASISLKNGFVLNGKNVSAEVFFTNSETIFFSRMEIEKIRYACQFF